MVDHCYDVFQTQPRRLAQMLDEHWDKARNWAADEMEAILRHQMDAPLDVDLAGYRSAPSSGGSTRSGQLTFRQLLRDSQPCPDLLHRVKDFAKGHLRQRADGLPRQIAKVLYYGSVLVARLRWDTRITRLSDAQLRLGLNWAIEQPWIEPWMQELFKKGLILLREEAE